MRKYRINCPLVVEHVPLHKRHQDHLLSLIKQSDGEEHDSILRTDYFYENPRQLYGPLFLTMINDVLKRLSGEFVDFSNTTYRFEPYSPWYQRYQKNDHHSWHDHAFCSTLSIIYYLELPKGAPGTEFLDPYTGRIHRPRVKEGDVLMFPSFVRHRSPKNKSDQIKTIISMNLA